MDTVAERTRPPLAPALLWLALALTAGATGLLPRMPVPGPQLVIVVLAAATVVAGFRSARLRSWLAGLDPRSLVAPHIVRLPIGVLFLVLAGQGRLSPLFARNAGWGDIVVGALAIVIVALGAAVTPARRGALAAWNAIGLLDFVLVLGTAVRVAMQDPASLGALLRLPLSLVPTFVVPLLIASHVFLFWRLARTARGDR